MKANEFIKKYGLEEAKNLYCGNDWSTVSEIFLIDLKRLIESHNLVKDLGGLIVAKRISDQAKEDGFMYLYANIKQAVNEVERQDD